MSAARGVLENENASQEEVHTALETLTKAKEALVLKEDKDPDDNTGNTGKPGSGDNTGNTNNPGSGDNTGNTDNPGSGKNPSNVNKPGTAGTGKNVNKTNKTVSKNPSTGDHAYVAFYLMLIGAAGVVITFAVRKKTR